MFYLFLLQFYRSGFRDDIFHKQNEQNNQQIKQRNKTYSQQIKKKSFFVF